MKLSDSFTNGAVSLVAFAAIGIIGVDTVSRLFFKKPAGGQSESTVSTAIGKARPWSQEEQQVLSKLLLPCRDQAMSGHAKEMVDCWLVEAHKAPPPKQGRSDEEIVKELLKRAEFSL